jgi:effector-binding domain-containing protein
MVTDPKIVDRPEQHTVGIRAWVALPEFSSVIDKLFPEVFAWLEKQGIAPAGAPFIRYHVINMETQMEVEIGVPVAKAVPGNGRVSADVLPAGRYATLLYTGHYSGLMEANGVLIDWAKEKGIKWDRWDDARGDAFRSRYESYITDPGKEPNPDKWETEVAIKLADH